MKQCIRMGGHLQMEVGSCSPPIVAVVGMVPTVLLMVAVAAQQMFVLFIAVASRDSKAKNN